MPKKIYLISACLLGLPTRYDGGHNRLPSLRHLCRSCILIPVCPEQLGGLPTPRRPSEISGGGGSAVLRGEALVLDERGGDLTAPFLRGAQATLQLARLYRVDGAILKSRSPSCGAGAIYDGSFSRRLLEGDGVAAALLKRHRFPLYTEKSLPLPPQDSKCRRFSLRRRRRRG